MIRRKVIQLCWALALIGTGASAQQLTEHAKEFAESGTAVLVADVTQGRLAGFGPLLSEETIAKAPYSNRFLRFNGLYAWLIRPLENTGPWRLAQIQISNGGPSVKFNLSPGTTKSVVQKTLGKPGRVEGRHWLYFGESTEVRFEFHGANVRKIVWNLHAD